LGNPAEGRGDDCWDFGDYLSNKCNNTDYKLSIIAADVGTRAVAPGGGSHFDFGFEHPFRTVGLDNRG